MTEAQAEANEAFYKWEADNNEQDLSDRDRMIWTAGWIQAQNLTNVSDDPKDVLIAGKTVQDIKYVDPWGEGITIRFTDGSELYIYERMQAGEIIVMFNGQEVAHGRS